MARSADRHRYNRRLAANTVQTAPGEMQTLSILIPTLESRAALLAELLSVLAPQLTSEVEVLTEADDGTRSIGHKRNALLQRAGGEYVCFIDDDDLIACDYVEKILAAMVSGPDCVGMHLLHFVDGVLAGFTYHSIKYSNWHHSTDHSTGYIRYYRNPNHLNPVKREHALQCRFPDISFGEDRTYSMQIRKFLKTERYIVEPIYYYLFRSRKGSTAGDSAEGSDTRRAPSPATAFRAVHSKTRRS
jgi:glycosyltransferase involved in cell wall biosynthesis